MLLRRFRLYWRLAFIKGYAGKSLNRRVDVENVLLNVAAGKRPMLAPQECRELAMKLGAD